MSKFKVEIKEVNKSYTQESINSLMQKEPRGNKHYSGAINLKVTSVGRTENIEIFTDDQLVETLYATISSNKSGILQGISTVDSTIFAIDFLNDTVDINPTYIREASMDKNINIISEKGKTYFLREKSKKELDGSYFASGNDWVCTKSIKKGLAGLDIYYSLYSLSGDLYKTATNFAIVGGEPVLSDSKVLLWRKY